MRLKRISKFTRSVTKGLKQATICQVVCGLIVCRSLILAEIARCFQTDTAFRHNLKRVFRYADNERITNASSKEVVARRLIRATVNRCVKADQAAASFSASFTRIPSTYLAPSYTSFSSSAPFSF